MTDAGCRMRYLHFSSWKDVQRCTPLQGLLPFLSLHQFTFNGRFKIQRLAKWPSLVIDLTRKKKEEERRIIAGVAADEVTREACIVRMVKICQDDNT